MAPHLENRYFGILRVMRPPRFDGERNVTPERALADMAALLGDPSRAAMLSELMGGRALTATELAAAAEISASTASTHLARLTSAGLLGLVKQGRHSYFRIANAQVAETVERMQCLSVASGSLPRCGPAEAALRQARCCYDHLAGAQGVLLLDRLIEGQLLQDDDGNLTLTRAGETWCANLGIDLPTLRMSRRPLCRSCLDWSERRMHLAGALGAALLARLLALRYLSRSPAGRALEVTARGRQFLKQL